MRQKEAALFLPNAYEELSRQERVEKGVFILQVEYLCQENIAVEVPLDENLPTQ